MNPLAGPTPALLRAYIGDEGGPGNAAAPERQAALRRTLRHAPKALRNRPLASMAILVTLKPLEGVRACVFDAYGTLFDLASAARRCADVLGDQAAPLTALWREKQLQYTWLLAAQGRHADFGHVTSGALDFALETLYQDSLLMTHEPNRAFRWT
jgi:hypothetical protein